MSCPYMTFSKWDGQHAVKAAFILRCPSVDVGVEKDEALKRLATPHARTLRTLGMDHLTLQLAEQVHGNAIFHVTSSQTGAIPISGVDALITNRPDICLGIYVADCAAVYIVDTKQHAIGLIHSGKKGTELGIVPATIEAMQDAFSSQPEDLLIQISPCIRPPDYEIDFATMIREQAKNCGIEQIFDGGENTATDLTRYYSYRKEKGKTGRMLALLALDLEGAAPKANIRTQMKNIATMR